jgi:hypothetical protein
MASFSELPLLDVMFIVFDVLVPNSGIITLQYSYIKLPWLFQMLSHKIPYSNINPKTSMVTPNPLPKVHVSPLNYIQVMCHENSIDGSGSPVSGAWPILSMAFSEHFPHTEFRHVLPSCFPPYIIVPVCSYHHTFSFLLPLANHPGEIYPEAVHWVNIPTDRVEIPYVLAYH